MKPRLTEEVKLRRKHERKAIALNDRAIRKVGGPGSIFAELAETFTVEEAAWHQRRTRALMIVHLHTTPGSTLNKALKAIQLGSIESHARTLLGEETFLRLRDFSRHCYQDITGYGYGFWLEVLSGEKVVVFEWRRIPADNTLGFSAVPVLSFPPEGWTPVISKAEFYARWPYAIPPDMEEPDDGGLFERVMAALNART